METEKLEQSKNSLERLKKSVDELIEIIHKQQADFAQKLQAEQGKTALESAKAEVLNNENEKLKAELEAAKNNTENETRMQQMQNEIENKAAKINNLQNEVQNLNNALANRKTQLEEFEAKNTPESRFAHTMDNLQPVILNAATDGKAWKEHQVRLSQFMGRQEDTPKGSETLWRYEWEKLVKPFLENGIIRVDE